MVKHIILWRLREDLTAEEKESVKQGIKAGLEGLAGRIPGMVDITLSTRQHSRPTPCIPNMWQSQTARSAPILVCAHASTMR